MFARHHRAGFSIVEMLVALVVAGVGLLALVGADTLAWRRRMRADHAAAGAHAVARRIEVLAALGCGLAASGSAVADSVTERWSVAVGARGLLLLEARASWPTNDGRRDSTRLAGSRWCG